MSNGNIWGGELLDALTTHESTLLFVKYTPDGYMKCGIDTLAFPDQDQVKRQVLHAYAKM